MLFLVVEQFGELIHFDFGLNSPPNERILIRNVLHCAPLATEGNMITTNNTVAFDYGPATGINKQGEIFPQNYTYSVEDLPDQYDAAPPGSVYEADYRLIVLHAATVAGHTGSAFTSEGFEPDERLARSDADIYLYFLSSPGVVSIGPSDDPWFRMTRFYRDLVFTHAMDNYSTYSPDVAASPLACANQYQFCSADKDHCGPLASFIDAVTGAAPAFGTTTDKLVETTLTEPVPGRFQRLALTLREFPLHFSTLYLGLGSESLLVKQTLNNLGVQGPLPTDQWQREMTAWWAATLAGLQTFFVQTASGVNFEGLEDYRDLEPVLPFEHDMCSNQVLSTAHGSFSVFGLSFTYVAGALIIILSYALEPLIQWRHRRYLRRHKDLRLEHHPGTYKDVEWTANNTLQLLRFAHENAGVGEWTRCDEDIPVLAGSTTQLCSLDLQEPAHPRLSREPMASENGLGVSTLELHGISPEAYSTVDDSPRTQSTDRDPSFEEGTVLPVTSTGMRRGSEAECLGVLRPVSPLTLPDFTRYED
ncbi:hypothetical protein KVR01_009546 [Diaporthe batatas]|uniref:uncharacterized protein n=1 Tax=Diaporthe batatas TaxID=748121 RepID=UPI001D037063|nr:uncharacterized protein KVR01_009546 [Diaporthe batatas]KAG8161282.1 hypothetical protein KVR01_009546 [Diaporthe batatas]